MGIGVRRYRDLCQKNDEENYFFDRVFLRKISIYFTIIFIKLKIKANQATFLSLVAALAACFFLVYNTPAMMVAAVVCIFLYNMLDHVDGELARYYIGRGMQKPSLKGQFFDVLVHKYSTNLFLFFLGVSVYNLYGHYFAVFLGFFACIGMSAFPNLLASQVVVQKIGANEQAVFDENVNDVLYLIEKKQEQISYLKSSGLLQRCKKILTELLLFPGSLLLIMAVIILDIFSSGFTLFSYEVNFRLLFLFLITPLYVANGIRQTVKWMKKFGEVI